MKKIILVLITAYQALLSPIFTTIFGTGKICRFEITCSEYAKKTISEYGTMKGAYMSLKRLLSCQPFYSNKAI